MIEVEIWSDFACPFCYIGKRNFELALSQFKNRDQVKVRFRSFELDPQSEKSQTQSIYQVLAKKYGQSLEWAHKANERVIQMGAECGLQMNIDKIIPTNSFDAHRLNHLAQAKDVEGPYQDSLFKAYFTDGIDIAKHDELLRLATRAGLAANEVEDVLNSQKYAQEVREDEAQAQENGISGVPFFLFNQQYGISGAQPVENFLQAFLQLMNKS